MSIYEIDPADKGTINEAWQTLMRNVGVRRSDFQLASTINNVANILGPSGVPLETSAAMTLYVATTGLDTNDGSVNRPLLTIQAAINKVPKTIKHPVTINVGAGTFDGARIDGFHLDNSLNTNSGSYLRVNGTLVNYIPATGITSGTATSGSAGDYGHNWSTLTVINAGWTPGELRGKLLTITGGTGFATSIRNSVTITSNTSDTITIPSAVSINNTTKFALQDWATNIKVNLVNPTYPLYGGSVYANSYGIVVEDTISNFIGITLFGLCLLGQTVSGTGGNGIYIYKSGCNIISSKFNNCSVGGEGAGFDVYVWGSYIYGDSSHVIRFGNYTQGGGCQQTIYNSLISTYGEGIVMYSGFNYVWNTEIELLGNYALVLCGDNTIEGVKIYKVNGTREAVILGNLSSSSLMFKSVYASIVSVDIVATNGINVRSSNGSMLIYGTNIISTGTAVNVYNGSNVHINSTTAISGGGTEILLDGVAKTLAEMRAGTPKYLTNATTGTRVWGD
jgi:hypothetical protein